MLRYDCECCASNRGASIQAPEPLEVSFWCPDGCEPVRVRKLRRFQQHLILLIFPFCGVRTKKEQAKLGCLSHVEALGQMQAARRSPLRTTPMPLVRIWAPRAPSDKGQNAQFFGTTRAGRLTKARHMTRRRTTASQFDERHRRAESGSSVNTRTDRPESSRRGPPRRVPLWRSRRETLPGHPEKAAPKGPTRYPACPESTVRDLAESS